MEPVKHRTGARVVAYIEVVLTSIFTVLYVLKVIITCIITLDHNTEDILLPNEPSDKQNVTPEFLMTMWVRLGCTGIVFCVQLWKTVLLFKATNEVANCVQGAEPSQAVYRAKTWRNVNMTCLAVGGAFSVEMYARITSWHEMAISVGIVIFLQSLLIYLVTKYINELKTVTKRRAADSEVLASLV